MKKVTVVRAEEVDVKPLELEHFTVKEKEKVVSKKISKKKLEEMADRLGLPYDDEKIRFAKKLMNAYMEKETK